MRYLSCVLGYKVGAWKGKKQKRNASCCQELGLELGRRKGARGCLGLDGCRVSGDLRPWGCCWQTASEKAGGYGNSPSGEAAQMPAHAISKRGLGREARRGLHRFE